MFNKNIAKILVFSLVTGILNFSFSSSAVSDQGFSDPILKVEAISDLAWFLKDRSEHFIGDGIVGVWEGCKRYRQQRLGEIHSWAGAQIRIYGGLLKSKLDPSEEAVYQRSRGMFSSLPLDLMGSSFASSDICSQVCGVLSKTRDFPAFKVLSCQQTEAVSAFNGQIRLNEAKYRKASIPCKNASLLVAAGHNFNGDFKLLEIMNNTFFRVGAQLEILGSRTSLNDPTLKYVREEQGRLVRAHAVVSGMLHNLAEATALGFACACSRSACEHIATTGFPKSGVENLVGCGRDPYWGVESRKWLGMVISEYWQEQELKHGPVVQNR